MKRDRGSVAGSRPAETMGRTARRRTARSAGRARLGLLLVAALGMPILAAAASIDVASGGSGGSGGAGPVSSSMYRAAVGFADLEYSVPFYGRLWSDHFWDQVDTPKAVATAKAQYFAEVAVAERNGSGLDLSFAVEGQSEDPGYEACHPHPDLGCNDVTVQATQQGLLYLHVPRNLGKTKNFYTHLGGFPRRSVELSASDAGSELKVYREVMVGPSPAAAGCDDYDDFTPEVYTCQLLRELLPPGQAGEADEKTLRAALPSLVQDSDNYRLVFAEEFNGDPPAADATGCRDGLATLDDAVWNYYDACDVVDSRGEPCGNVGEGGFTMAVTGTCKSPLMGPVGSVNLDTSGHLHMKYGYLELQYTFNLDQWPNKLQNLNMIMITRGHTLRYQQEQYGVEINSWEDLLKYTGVEIDLFEHTHHRVVELSHQYANHDGYHSRDVMRPTRTLKWTRYCDIWRPIRNPRPCKADDTFTVTRGIEWTPRGYRTFIKVDGIHNDLTLVPRRDITVQQKGPPGWGYERVEKNDRYFELLDRNDPGTLLEQVGVAHMPLPIFMNGWSYLDGGHPHIRKRLTFDYIRVWQPENHYTDMEPVYQ